MSLGGRSVGRFLAVFLLAAAWAAGGIAEAQEAKKPAKKDSTIYEMRIYKAADGKRDALLERFRDHTIKLFAKHGMTSIGYWLPTDDEEEIVYLLSFPNRAAREKAWTDFREDPEWLKIRQESEKNGILVYSSESFVLEPTDYSPSFEVAALGDRIFELRSYLANEGQLDALHDRFRKHTLKFFAKHGITNLAYWKVLDSGRKFTDRRVMFLLSHASVDAANESYEKLRQDAEWADVLRDSERQSGASLTSDDGVITYYLRPTDFSPLK